MIQVSSQGGGSSHKVYDAKSLVAAMKERHGHYQGLEDQMTSLRNVMLDMTKLDDAFQGKGADAIKGFYEAQVDVVDAWLDLIKIQLAFCKGVAAATEDKDLDGDNNFIQYPQTGHGFTAAENGRIVPEFETKYMDGAVPTTGEIYSIKEDIEELVGVYDT
ncbi:WXG superfamily protein probably secreted by type VII secretion system [Scopulibacillus darangshiensis]|uniref:WXG superfamily protein probably secreted by type VII secretion system n=1 Tax=Scopulibacillus darangshiensis TaxID=442528 RepID=A0A4R2P8B7_9BACL|nr:T7SS effector LXG polymorphic toxin [Scopulibacillus darangshiensis]TCP31209.1 WXG superfamily protein probably secreted by type VII secretion system [Scopulibacillus darangshiensis]